MKKENEVNIQDVVSDFLHNSETGQPSYEEMSEKYGVDKQTLENWKGKIMKCAQESAATYFPEQQNNMKEKDNKISETTITVCPDKPDKLGKQRKENGKNKIRGMAVVCIYALIALTALGIGYITGKVIDEKKIDNSAEKLNTPDKSQAYSDAEAGALKNSNPEGIDIVLKSDYVEIEQGTWYSPFDNIESVKNAKGKYVPYYISDDLDEDVPGDYYVDIIAGDDENKTIKTFKITVTEKTESDQNTEGENSEELNVPNLSIGGTDETLEETY